jgi:uncharacterized protein YodC (DUF2158 family)
MTGKSKGEFSVGDTVQLKSGGPVMTVAAVPGISDRNVRCQWFGGKKLESGYFAPETLVHIDPNQTQAKK